MNRFFIDVTPDLSASFIQLGLCTTVHHLDQILTINTSRYLSSGLAVRKRTDEANKFYEGTKNKHDICRHVPIKNRHIVTNIIINDYINVKKLIGKKLSKYDFDNYTYIKVCINEFARNAVNGIIFKKDIYDIFKYIKSFNLKKRIKLYLYFIYFMIKNLIRNIRNKLFFYSNYIVDITFKKKKYIKVTTLLN